MNRPENAWASTSGPVTSVKSSKAFRWTVGVGAGVMAALGLVLLFLLTQATGNRDLYERNYALLFALNVAVAALLVKGVDFEQRGIVGPLAEVFGIGHGFVEGGFEV